MFQLDLDPTFESTVPIQRPGGAIHKIRVTFHYLDQDAYNAAVLETKDKPNGAVALMQRLVAGWEERDHPQGDWQGMPMPFSPDALAALGKRQPRALQALLAVYLNESLGLPTKNW